MRIALETSHDQKNRGASSRGMRLKMQRSKGIMENRRFTIGIVGVYLFSLGLLCGILFDRIRFDESRTVILNELDEHKHRLNQRLMAMERETLVGQ
jgi:hypothetical protein